MELDRTKGVWSIDPGDVHVGAAGWVFDETAGAWTCATANEWTPEQAEDTIADYCATGDIAALVVERFQLYSDKAQQQTGSEFRTSQLIGVFKYLARVHGIPIYIQGASIKTPTRSVLKARKAQSVAKLFKAGGHALDAELHGFYFFSQTAAEPINYHPRTTPTS